MIFTVSLQQARIRRSHVVTLTRTELERHNVKTLAVQNNIAESPPWIQSMANFTHWKYDQHKKVTLQCLVYLLLNFVLVN